VSGQGFSHYYVVVFPQLVLVLILGLNELGTGRLQFAGASYMALMVVGVFVSSTALVYIGQGKSLRDAVIIHPVAAYVAEHTAPGDYVYAWARSGEINFQAQRLSPVQYFMAGHLEWKWDGRTKMIEKVVADLHTRPPALVVDLGVLDGLAPLSGPPDHADWQAIYDYVARNCLLVDRLFAVVPIYTCNGFELRMTS